ncbi:MAG: ribosome assembly RNA-binding protein YhbY [Pseudomonadota bacterium]
MNLTREQKKHLHTLAHSRKPIVRIGQKGLTDNVVSELDGALLAHELVKVKIAIGDREQRASIVEELAAKCGCETIKSIGQTVSFFRRNQKRPKIILP